MESVGNRLDQRSLILRQVEISLDLPVLELSRATAYRNEGDIRLFRLSGQPCGIRYELRDTRVVEESGGGARVLSAVFAFSSVLYFSYKAFTSASMV
mgnify:CR=1 FL=1